MHVDLVTIGSAGGTALGSSSSAATSGGSVGQEPSAGAIRGRGLPPGSDATVCNPTGLGLGGRAAIRGRDDGALGCERGGSDRPARRVHDVRQIARGAQDDNGSMRVRESVKRPSPGMEWYFADIADTVAKRRAIHGAHERPSATDRMAALRRRIASRARGAGDEEEAAPITDADAAPTRPHDYRRSLAGSGEEKTSWGRQSTLEPVAVNDGPSCGTASTEAATEVAHHAIESGAERQGVGEERRRSPTLGALASRNARQALIDRLSSRTRPPERTV